MTSKFLRIKADESISFKQLPGITAEALQDWLAKQPEDPAIKYRSYDRLVKGNGVTVHIYRGWKENPFPDGGCQPINRYKQEGKTDAT